MLFNSYPFIFLFLPVVLLLFFSLGAERRRAALISLTLASLFYYGWWNPKYLVLIVGSMTVNFKAGVFLRKQVGTAQGKSVLVAMVVANLLVLGYFKYAAFVVDNLAAVTGQSWSLGEIILPLGISFFTFQKIAYLVDAYQGKTSEHDFVDFSLFVTFFPQLIAGPIVHHQQVMPQFKKSEVFRFRADNMSIGVAYFVLGLFKKVVLADGVARYASPVFAAAVDAGPGFWLSWQGALAYSLQIYFDFSGYSDMAVGLGRMFNIVLPQNFESPYKAVSMIDFWRRWHITLSTFLRDYLYIPLGGNRQGDIKKYRNILLTMLIGGVWHGAGWQFVLWGAIHGVGITINHVWADHVKGKLSTLVGSMGGRFLTRLVTLFVVVIGWVFFRATDMATAGRMLADMFSPGDMVAGWKAYLGEGLRPAAWILGLWVVAVFCPNARTIVETWVPEGEQGRKLCWYHWRPTRGWAVVTALVFVVALLHLSQVSEFLYFQF